MKSQLLVLTILATTALAFNHHRFL
jgi:hypothetical protein